MSNESADDFSAFRVRPVIRDFKLNAELFASNGDIVLICGRGNQERQGMFLVSYEIPPASAPPSAQIRLARVNRISKRTVTQLETVIPLELALLLGDGTVTLLDVHTLTEITSVPVNNAAVFATWYDIPTSANASTFIPTELRICVANKRRSLLFYRWLSKERRLEANADMKGGFDLFDVPQALGLSHDKVCAGYRRSYAILSLINGMVLREVPFNMTQSPVINYFPDRRQWSIQVEANTIFYTSDFEPAFTNGVIWKDIPSMVVYSSPYVLALLPQSIDICTFNGTQSVPVQSIAHRSTTTVGKCRLWMDAKTQRIYAANITDVGILEPISIGTQLKNYVGSFKYDLGLILIRGVLGISVTTSTEHLARTSDGHAQGNLDWSQMPKEFAFDENPMSNDVVESRSNSLSDSSRSNGTPSESELWAEYYRVGTMDAFQLFHRHQYEQAFSEFNDFLCDPAEIVSLFTQLASKIWLPNVYNPFRTFVSQHRQFAEPNDFVGIKFENALRELQKYLTELRRIFQLFFRRTPEKFLEVQSLMKNRMILRPVRDLLTIVETALLKVYLIDNNNALANALLRNEHNCCLASEVERELTRHNRRTELISFYKKQNRHEDALKLIDSKTNGSADQIIDYLTELGNEHLSLIFKYVEPILRSTLEKTNETDLLHDILMLFTGDPSAIPSSPLDTPAIRTLKLDPIEVHEFLRRIDQDFSIRYLDTICLKPELGFRQSEVQNRLVFAYCDRIKELSKKIRSFSPSNDEQNGNVAPLKRSLAEFSTKLKYFLLNENCRCNFETLDAFFQQEKSDPSNDHLFSLHYAIILGKLNRHRDALKTFVQNGFLTDAENYCETIFSNGNFDLARQLYRQLIEHYLERSQNENVRDQCFTSILRLVNQHAERLDPVETLQILPENFKLNFVKDFIENSLQTCSTHKRSSQLERNLLFAKLLRAQSKRIFNENNAFVINLDSRCARSGCTQPFTATQAVVRFPNNQIVHLHCRTKYEKELETLTRGIY